jgi:hypothetical protein
MSTEYTEYATTRAAAYFQTTAMETAAVEKVVPQSYVKYGL